MKDEQIIDASEARDHIEMAGVREYGEEFAVELVEYGGRFIVRAYNEGGFNLTLIDLLDLLAWVKQNKPGLWEQL